MALTKTERRALKGLRRMLEMERFSASMIARIYDCYGVPIDATKFIREETRVWRESWILSTIDALLEGDAKLARDLVS